MFPVVDGECLYGGKVVGSALGSIVGVSLETAVEDSLGRGCFAMELDPAFSNHPKPIIIIR